MYSRLSFHVCVCGVVHEVRGEEEPPQLQVPDAVRQADSGPPGVHVQRPHRPDRGGLQRGRLQRDSQERLSGTTGRRPVLGAKQVCSQKQDFLPAARRQVK